MNPIEFGDIFADTFLSKLPIKYRWIEETDDNNRAYNVSNGAFTMNLYKTWIEYDEFKSPDFYRGYLTHDIAHLVLYAMRDEWDKVMQSNFGLTWEKVERAGAAYTIFHDSAEYIDEIKIVCIQHVLNAAMAFSDVKNITREYVSAGAYGSMTKNISMDVNRSLEIETYLDELFDNDGISAVMKTIGKLEKRMKEFSKVFTPYK